MHVVCLSNVLPFRLWPRHLSGAIFFENGTTTHVPTGPFAPAPVLMPHEVRHFLRLCVSPAMQGARPADCGACRHDWGRSQEASRDLHGGSGERGLRNAADAVDPSHRVRQDRVSSDESVRRRPEPVADRRTVSVFLTSRRESKSDACVRFASRWSPHPRKIAVDGVRVCVAKTVSVECVSGDKSQGRGAMKLPMMLFSACFIASPFNVEMACRKLRAFRRRQSPPTGRRSRSVKHGMEGRGHVPLAVLGRASSS